MGSSSSKVARGATRKYPTRASGNAIPTPIRTPAAKQKPVEAKLGDTNKDEAIRADGHDPDFAPGDFSRRLYDMGIAEPNPTYSPSSTASSQVSHPPPGPTFAPRRTNVTLSALEARKRLEEQAEEDFATMGLGQGRRFLDIKTVADAVKMRDRGVKEGEIEAKLRIKKGLLGTLGPKGALTHVSED